MVSYTLAEIRNGTGFAKGIEFVPTGGKVFVVGIENDHEMYLSDAYTTREAAETQLAWVRGTWTERYGADGFDEDETDDDVVAVLDGPSAYIRELSVSALPFQDLA